MPSLKDTLFRFRCRIGKQSSNGPRTSDIRSGPEDLIREKIESEIDSLSPRKSEARSERKSLGEFIGRHDPPEMRARYGALPLMQSSEDNGETWTPISQERDVSQLLGQEVHFRARLYVVRPISPKLAFLVLQDQLTTIQCVLEIEEDRISESMVKWAQHIRAGSIVQVKGKMQAPREPVTGTSIHDAEVLIAELHVVSERTASIPFSVYEAEANHDAQVSDRARLHNRILDLRTPTSQGIFRIQSGVCNLFRNYLDSKGFTEIHTPKLQGGATEGGSSVFRVEYFGRPSFLAQSPQLAKQMCIAGDLGRVYEVGPVFRAENSNTSRHMTEYTGLDIEMEIQTHYHETMRMIDETLKSIFKGVYERYRPELEAVKRHFPHEDLVWLEKTPIIPFAEGIKMLRDSGWKEEDGGDPSEHQDLATKAEKRLGELVKEQLKTDFYILDKFPISARPFYTMPDPKNDKITNSFDFFLRGQEILSGGQRIHDATFLEKRLLEQKMNADQMQEYLEGFRWVAPPHAGAGIGLERLVSLLLQLENVRYASLFPRDPKSFPVQPGSELRYPEDTTLLRRTGRLQLLENLVANYGDATNTSWMDERYQIWRDIDTGAAVAYVPIRNYVIIPGNPLCDASQYSKIMEAFLKWVRKELRLKPIWLLVDREVEDVLASKYGWKSLSCTAEQRIDLSSAWKASESNTKQKISRAKREGVKVIDLGNEVPEEMQQKCNDRITDWQKNRTGEQVHLSDITPWKDMTHRRYFIAQDTQGTVCALVVLAQLSSRNGVQIKWALEFPNSPSGTIEHATVTAIEAARDAGSRRLTFGIGASSRLSSGENMSAMRSNMLDNIYQTISARLKLTQKSEFRAKFNTFDDPVYICYPPGGFGVGGPKAIMDFFKD